MKLMVNRQEEIEKGHFKVEDCEYKVDLSLAFGRIIHSLLNSLHNVIFLRVQWTAVANTFCLFLKQESSERQYAVT